MKDTCMKDVLIAEEDLNKQEGNVWTDRSGGSSAIGDVPAIKRGVRDYRV